VSDGRPKLFLNCAQLWFCYEDYVKTELSAFDFVRDRFQADVELLVIRQDGANGGAFYTVEFIPHNAFQAQCGDTLTFSTNQADTDDMVRSELVKTLKLGVVRYAMKSNLRSEITLDFKKRDGAQLTKQADPWNYWVFNVGINGSFEGESNYRQIWLDNWLNVRRVTDESKIAFNIWYGRRDAHFVVNGKETSAFTERFGAFGQYVKSLDNHWSVGVTYLGEHSVFRNLQFAQRITPAVEYNVFLYTENTRRQLRLVYEVGYQHFQFIQETVFDKMQEGRPLQRVSVITDWNQSWGSINVVLRGVSFLDKLSQHRFSVDARLNLRVVEGLSINLFGSASLIRDQISLAKADVSQSTALLQAQQLPTSFSYWSSVGVSYTFGSIFNSVVNPRLGQIE
jgi:hypothetical protein